MRNYEDECIRSRKGINFIRYAYSSLGCRVQALSSYVQLCMLETLNFPSSHQTILRRRNLLQDNSFRLFWEDPLRGNRLRGYRLPKNLLRKDSV